WKNEYQRWGEHGVICGLSARPGSIVGEWITKWDGAEETDIEATKGGLSGAMKRAAVQWGIGRYLYDLEETFANCGDKGTYRAKVDAKNADDKTDHWFRWSPPSLPIWALPGDAGLGPRASDNPPSPLPTYPLSKMQPPASNPESFDPVDGDSVLH